MGMYLNPGNSGFEEIGCICNFKKHLTSLKIMRYNIRNRVAETV